MKHSSKLSPKVVQVKWEDACTRGGWAESKQARREKGIIVYTVGYLLEITPKYIRLFSSQSPEDTEVGVRKIIPRGWVRKISYLYPRSSRG